jgi:hypothetical protein
MGLADRDYYRDEFDKMVNRHDNSNRKPPRPPNNNIPWGIIIALIIGFIAGVYSVSVRSEDPIAKQIDKFVGVGKNLSNPKIPRLLPSTDLSLSEQPLPENGSCKMVYPSEHYVASFTVKADSINHYLVKLVDSSQNPVLYLFVRANSSVKIKAPLGAYELRWACGEKWYGYEHLFGSSSKFKKALQPFDFHEEQTSTGKQIVGHYVTFNNIISGNLPSTQINANEF